MKITIFLFVVGFCLISAKYLPYESSDSNALLRSKRSDSDDSISSLEQSKDVHETGNNDDGDDDSDDEDSSLEKILKEKEIKRQEKEEKLRRKLEEKQAKEQRKLEEKREKEERKRLERIEKEKCKEEERKRKLLDKHEKEEKKKQEKQLKELQKLEKETLDDGSEEFNFLEEEDNSIELEDIWKNYIYVKYGLTFASTKLERQLALNKYLEEELGLNANSTTSDRYQAITKLIQTKLQTEAAELDVIKNIILSHINALRIQQLRTELEKDLEELKNKTEILSNVSLPWVPIAKQQIDEKRSFLQTISQLFSNILPNWVIGGENSTEQNLNNNTNNISDIPSTATDGNANVVSEGKDVGSSTADLRPVENNKSPSVGIDILSTQRDKDSTSPGTVTSQNNSPVSDNYPNINKNEPTDVGTIPSEDSNVISGVNEHTLFNTVVAKDVETTNDKGLTTGTGENSFGDGNAVPINESNRSLSSSISNSGSSVSETVPEVSAINNDKIVTTIETNNPSISTSDIGLSISGSDIPVNSKNINTVNIENDTLQSEPDSPAVKVPSVTNNITEENFVVITVDDPNIISISDINNTSPQSQNAASNNTNSDSTVSDSNNAPSVDSDIFSNNNGNVASSAVSDNAAPRKPDVASVDGTIAGSVSVIENTLPINTEDTAVTANDDSTSLVNNSPPIPEDNLVNNTNADSAPITSNDVASENNANTISTNTIDIVPPTNLNGPSEDGSKVFTTNVIDFTLPTSSQPVSDTVIVNVPSINNIASEVSVVTSIANSTDLNSNVNNIASTTSPVLSVNLDVTLGKESNTDFVTASASTTNIPSISITEDISPTKSENVSIDSGKEVLNGNNNTSSTNLNVSSDNTSDSAVLTDHTQSINGNNNTSSTNLNVSSDNTSDSAVVTDNTQSTNADSVLTSTTDVVLTSVTDKDLVGNTVPFENKDATSSSPVIITETTIAPEVINSEPVQNVETQNSLVNSEKNNETITTGGDNNNVNALSNNNAEQYIPSEGPLVQEIESSTVDAVTPNETSTPVQVNDDGVTIPNEPGASLVDVMVQ